MNGANDELLEPRPSTLDRPGFVARFGGIYEHSPWIAEAIWDAGLTAAQDTVSGLHTAMANVLAAADRDAKLALIRAHPQLAVAQGALTAASRSEQAAAGLDSCTDAEFERFQALKRAYDERFGFPFIIAVRGLTRADILAAFERRVGHDPETEFAEALRQIERIARIRLAKMASES